MLRVQVRTTQTQAHREAAAVSRDPHSFPLLLFFSSCACGRCLSHCWFLTACCGFILLSSLPRFLALLDFLVTALIYSLSFAGRSHPSITFWEFLKDDFTHYKFQTSGGSLLILSFMRMVILFFVFAYRFHRRPFAMITASAVAATSAMFIMVKFALNENDHLLSLLIWSLGITALEYTVWLALRRRRIKQPTLSHITIPQPETVAEETMDTTLLSPVASSEIGEIVSSGPRDVRSAKQLQSYQRLGFGGEDDIEVGASMPTSILTSQSYSQAYSAPYSIPRMSSSSSFGSPFVGSSSLGNKPIFPRTEQEVDPQALADPDSLFVQIDSIMVHYKLSVNGRPVLSGSASEYYNRDDSHDESYEEEPLRMSPHTKMHNSHQAGSTPQRNQQYFDSHASAGRAAMSDGMHGGVADSDSAGDSAKSTFQSPMILLHGFGSSLFAFRSIWRELSQHTPILLAFDRPGFGLTSRPTRDAQGSFGTVTERHANNNRPAITREQENPYTQEYAVGLLFKLMRKLGLESHRSVLVGHSTGGALALRAAITQPNLFKACFLIAPHVYTAGFPAILKSLLKTKLGKLITQQLVRSELGEVALKRAWFDPAHIPPEALNNYQKTLRCKGSMEALIELAASVPGDDDPWSKLSSRLRELATAGRPSHTYAHTHAQSQSHSDDDSGPTICLLHGIQDKLLDVSESIKAYTQMKAEGVNVTLIKIGQSQKNTTPRTAPHWERRAAGDRIATRQLGCAYHPLALDLPLTHLPSFFSSLVCVAC